ncbi:putative RNA-binding Zn ribbon-like protein [Leifsonia sp. AK011]|nr:putative RNA-binding Zn ribbon-like protein [Leifsonia sp. AK011]
MKLSNVMGLGDNTALDFLNSTVTQGASTFEFIESGHALVGWLHAAGLVSHDESRALLQMPISELDAQAAQARELREWLRSEVARWAELEKGEVSIDASVRLNELMAVDDFFRQLDSRGDLVLQRRWSSPRQLLAPIAHVFAELLSMGETAYVRRCEGTGCTMWFYDHTKSHRRRWCSMALCGNREKARNHRLRQATATSSERTAG